MSQVHENDGRAPRGVASAAQPHVAAPGAPVPRGESADAPDPVASAAQPAGPGAPSREAAAAVPSRPVSAESSVDGAAVPAAPGIERPASVPAAPAVTAPTVLAPKRQHRWLVAAAGVAAAFLALQVVSTLFGMLLVFINQAGIVIDGAVSSGAAISEADVDLVLERAFAILDDPSSIQMALISAGGQLLAFAVMYPWWRHVRRRSLMPRIDAARLPVSPLRAGSGLVLLGFAIQVVLGVVLTLVLPLFPETSAEYDQLMAPATGDALLVEMVSVALLAPLLEEVACRGVMLEYALRWAHPAWRGATEAPVAGGPEPLVTVPAHGDAAGRTADPTASAPAVPPAEPASTSAPGPAAPAAPAAADPVPPAATSAPASKPAAIAPAAPAPVVGMRAFWVANVVQALLFGVMHGNIVQGLYTFATGLLLGLLCWRLGDLRYPILLHFGLNVSSYLVDPLSDLLCALVPESLQLAAYALVGVGSLAVALRMLAPVFRPAARRCGKASAV